MRPPVRLLKPLEAPSLRNSKNALYVCSNCRYDASLLPSSTQHNHQSRRYASGNTPFTEKLRRRIWGTDNPPGLEDPYGGEGVIASEWAKRKAQYMGKHEQKEEGGEEQIPAEEERDHEYEDGEDLIPEEFNPATTAHDLPRMGHLSQWSDFPPTEGDIYQPFVSLKKASDSAQFRSAAKSVAIELSILHELKKPLSLACDVPRHDERIWQMIRKCQISEGSLKFPDNKEKKILLFVFNQLGETPSAQTEDAAAEATEQPEAEAEATVDTTEQLEAEAVAEPEERRGIVDAVYSYALKATKPPKHEGYLDFSLADPAVKFAFFKRYSQITGHHMQDICAYKAQTVGDVIAHVERIYLRPKKLAPELRKINIPKNVAIYSKRYTKGQQDRENGRAKLVEAALRERGLLRSEQEDKSSRFSL
ncbi:hypothetical protein ZTR_03332 [Talaromyces verruculosus]|nr:hypothetical protein ZTR_03332 [Talaromyces verruculosus]